MKKFPTLGLSIAAIMIVCVASVAQEVNASSAYEAAVQNGKGIAITDHTGKAVTAIEAANDRFITLEYDVAKKPCKPHPVFECNPGHGKPPVKVSGPSSIVLFGIAMFAVLVLRKSIKHKV